MTVKQSTLGLTLEVISLPGHTPGEICLLLKEKRILFTGDSINHHLWMQLEESLPLRIFLENLNRISWVTEKADRILHGHAQGFDDISLFDELKSGIKELIETKGKGNIRHSKEYNGSAALQNNPLMATEVLFAIAMRSLIKYFVKKQHLLNAHDIPVK